MPDEFDFDADAVCQMIAEEIEREKQEMVREQMAAFYTKEELVWQSTGRSQLGSRRR